MMCLATKVLRWFGLGALLAGCRAAAVRPTTTSASDAVPQCYELRLEPWSPATPPLHIPPRVIRLDTALAYPESAQPDSLRSLEPTIPSLAQPNQPSDRLPFQWWDVVAPDTLQLTWSGGFEGTFITLAQRGDSLIGHAVAWTDYPVNPRPRAAVAGWRVPCSRLKLARD